MLEWTGLIIGFLGSVHCIGMCGPIAIALPAGFSSSLRLLLSRLTYNVGRVLTYCALGAISGLLGKSIAMAGFQRSLSITAGALIALGVLLPVVARRRLLPLDALPLVLDRVKSLWGRLFAKRTIWSVFVIGILNGFLPCGFLYVGLAASAATGGVVSATAYMALFGLGTVPAMLATSFFGGFLTVRVKQYLLKLMPATALVVAVLLILRGLSLGIPYISPILPSDSIVGQPPSCH